MDKKAFVRYWSSQTVHDAKVREVIQESERVRVLLDTADGRLVGFEFSGVESVELNRPEGMLLYSLSEVEATPPYRRFSFVNWDEEDDACLEIIAREIISDEPLNDSN